MQVISRKGQFLGLKLPKISQLRSPAARSKNPSHKACVARRYVPTIASANPTHELHCLITRSASICLRVSARQHPSYLLKRSLHSLDQP